MASIITPTPWTSQPQYAAPINRAKAAETGTIWLAFANEGGTLRDLIGGQSLTNPGGNSVSTGGKVWTYNGSQAQNKLLTLPSGIDYENIVVCARIKATGTQAGTPGNAFGIFSSTSQGGIGVGFDPSNNVGGTILNSTGAALVGYSAGTQGTWYTVYANGLSTAGSSFVKAWINGLPATTTQGTQYGYGIPWADELCVGAQHRSSGYLRYFTGQIEWASIIYLPGPSDSYTMTDELAARLYKSGYPYNLVQPIPRRIYVGIPASGGSPYSLAVDGTSYSLTYSNPTLAASRKLGLDATSFAITPSTVGLKADRKLGVDATSLTLSFSATQLVAARKLGVSATSYALTFEDPSLSYVPSSGDYQFGVDGTTYSITYADPVFKRTLVTNVDATSLALTFSDPSFSQGFGATVGRPVADDVTGSWHPSSGAVLYDMLDEISADDADYIYANSATTCEVGLNGVADPGTSSGQVLSYRAWSPTGNGLTVTLKQGATTIATWTHVTLPLTATTFTQSLSASECDAITDYTALSVEMTSL